MNPPKYIAQLQHVREVSLLGLADLAFWAERLRPESLHPAVVDGRAQILISGVSSRFIGLAFRELVIAVSTSNALGGGGRDGAFLLYAFNSSRLLGWSERTFFSTPYYHAHVDVAIGPPAQISVTQAGQLLLRAEMAPGNQNSSREALRHSDETWEGPIHISSGRQFFARLGGITQSYAFDPTRDVLKLQPASGVPVLQWLIDSNYRPQEWAIREDAHHARSKTFRRKSG